MKKKAPLSGSAVIYARYSSHNQREESIEQQVKKCQEYAERNGYTITKIYADKAITGKTDQRPQFQLMMKYAKREQFDYIIAWKSNRIGRNMTQAMVNMAKLAECGVKCLYVEEDFDDTAAGRFALRNMMNVNQFYSENMAEDIRRGMMDNAEKCMVNGRIAYGFRKGKDGKFEVVEEEAAVIREIYDRVLDDWKHVDIVTDLNNRGIKNRDGREWKISSFDKLLRNEQYIGVYTFADVRIENGIPPILDRNTFEEVQRKLKSKKNPRGRKREVEEYLLTGKLFCGKCQHPMVGISGTSRTGIKHYYYACQGKRQKLCDKKNVLKDEIEGSVIGVVRSLIMDEETIDWIVAGYKHFIESARQESAVTSMERELADVNKSIENMIRAIEAGIITDSTRDRLLELEDQRKELQFCIDVERAALEELTCDEMRFIIEKCRDMNLEKRSYQKELIRLFVRAVYVYDNNLKIVVKNGLKGDATVPFSEVDGIENADSAVCIGSAKPHHKKPSFVYQDKRGFFMLLECQLFCTDRFFTDQNTIHSQPIYNNHRN